MEMEMEMEMEMDMEKSLQRVSKGVVPDWNNLTGHQLGQLAQPHVQFHFPQMPVSDHLVAVHGEDTNGVHFPPPMSFPSSKPRWGSCETLESIVRQATCCDVHPPKPEDSRARLQDCVGHRKVAKSSGPMHPSRVAPKRRRCESELGVREKNASGRGGGAASNTQEDDLNTIMTTKLAELEESFSHDESESKDEGGEAGRREMRCSNSQSQCPRQSKAAATHNLSEQRRRDRINEKMEALQKLVPNSSKTDKASMLDEVIAYTKQLQAQVEMMKLMRSSNSNNNGNNHVNVSQMMNAMMMMPAAALPTQQQLQMSLLTRMGAGLGLGMLDRASNVAANNAFVAPPQQLSLPPHFLMPQMIPSATFTASHLNPNVGGALASMPLHDPYATFLAQKMSMDNYYNKLAALHQQQTRHPVRSDKT